MHSETARPNKLTSYKPDAKRIPQPGFRSSGSCGGHAGGRRRRRLRSDVPYNLPWDHDVYLSFRGRDTRKNFVDHLYTALHQQGIMTHKDYETYLHGVSLGPSLMRAIIGSRIYVIIISQNYANSSWCLDELELITECVEERGQPVIPIFYHVDLEELQKPRGKYAQELVRLRGKDDDKVEEWRNALVDVSNLPGWELNSNPDSRESICIKQVVDKILNILSPNKDISRIGTPLQDLNLGEGGSFYNNSKQINRSMSSTPPSYCFPASKQQNHDVFLSFRREDTGNNFADHLYSALNQREILTYKKEETCPVGEFISPVALLKVIEKSEIIIIIFSENYADSSWCLDELYYIMKAGKIIIPVFYHVDPSDVRNLKRSYERAFAKHYQFESENKVRSWRDALKHATSLYGWNIEQIANGHESKGIQLIVDGILKRLYPDKGLIGTHTRLGCLKYSGGAMATLLSCSPEKMQQLKIPFQDIRLATSYFAREKIIARGGFGEIFRGQTEQHGTIAVKRLNRSEGQGDHEFMTEIELLSSYTHANIVSLIGYCNEGTEKILVYRYEKNGSLNNHLHNKEDLTWIRRLQICLDAAHGLEYLHDDVQHQHMIVHRDVKSSNILLDETWKAKISDFGLSRISLAYVPCSVIFSIACGTRGYIDPLYQEHNTLTHKSDVYSFGIVMLEVLFGRLVRDIPAEYIDEHYFSVRLAQNRYANETLDEIIDSDLRSQMNSDSLNTFTRIAYQCLKKSREERPTMSQVVDQLEKVLDFQRGTSGFLYDVYISFRARDSECHIVDDIRAALEQEEISTNNDDETQSRKESILLKAIERSRLFVIIFTKKFAVNPWYLDEVAKIIECMKEKGQFVLPVFYNVSHYDVRTQKGYFGEVMSEFDTHPRMEVWRNALVEATNAPGLEYSNFWCSADLVKKIVEEIKSGLSAQVN